MFDYFMMLYANSRHYVRFDKFITLHLGVRTLTLKLLE